MTLHEKLILHDCPYCGGAGLLEEEQGWCWYAMCLNVRLMLGLFVEKMTMQGGRLVRLTGRKHTHDRIL